jgi:lipopolysaccharide biosynthesis regulator YciM
MSPLPRMKPILPWWQLGALLALCGAGIYFLLPDDPKLIENLVRDGNTREARRLLERVPTERRARDRNRFRLLELRLARRELPPADAASATASAARRAALEAFWRQATAAWRDTRYADAVFHELAAIIPQLADPGAAWSLIAPEIEKAPSNQRTLLGEVFARAALAQNQPRAAAEAFATSHPPHERSPAHALELSRLWQLAGQPEAALAALGEIRAPEVNARRLALLREVNRNGEALALLQAQAEAAPATAPDARLTEQIGDVALAAGTPAEAIPAYTRYVAANPQDLAAVRRLRALHVAAGRPENALEPARRAAALSHRDPLDLLELARISEWSSRANDAFDLWLELALRNHPGALERLLALNPGLFRDEDLSRALEHAERTAPTLENLLARARLEVDLGRYGRAREAFEAYLAQRADPQVMIELARVLRENFEFSGAEQWLRRAATAQPTNVDLHREIAELLVYQGRYPEALTAYGELLPKSDAEEIIGPFTRLAEALGRFDEFARGLQRRIEASPAPVERDFVLLAYAHELAGHGPARRAALQEGLRRFPASDDLRLQIAYLESADQNYRAALQTLAPHTNLRGDLAAASLYLDLLRLNNDVTGERRFLAAPLGGTIAQDDAILERIARAREASRDYAEAIQIYRGLLARDANDVTRAGNLARVYLTVGRHADARRLLAPFLREPTPAILRLAADVAAAAGDQRAAETYQAAFLAASAEAPAPDWGALGDIRLSRGDRIGAKRAYAEALRRMHADLRREGPR